MNEIVGDVKRDEVLACAFDRWYEDFRDVTFRSRVIPLPEEFVQYLMSDGIHMPGGTGRNETASDDDSEWGDGGSESGGSQNGTQETSFPDVEDAVCRAIADLDGAVLPKLSWSAPKDSKWIYGTLKCENVQEVFTLLKASDFVAHDLCHSFDHCSDFNGGPSRPDAFFLVLRQWRAFDESNEFRCFVNGGRLRAVSQRHTPLFFPHLVDPLFTVPLVQKISAFFEARVRPKFPLERYAFDVLVGKPPRHKVHLIDFSPWSGSTDPLLFDWEELSTVDASENVTSPPEFRAVCSESEKRGKLENYHQVPLEVAQLGFTSPEEFEELCKRAEANLGPR